MSRADDAEAIEAAAAILDGEALSLRVCHTTGPAYSNDREPHAQRTLMQPSDTAERETRIEDAIAKRYQQIMANMLADEHEITDLIADNAAVLAPLIIALWRTMHHDHGIKAADDADRLLVAIERLAADAWGKQIFELARRRSGS